MARASFLFNFVYHFRFYYRFASPAQAHSALCGRGEEECAVFIFVHAFVFGSSGASDWHDCYKNRLKGNLK